MLRLMAIAAIVLASGCNNSVDRPTAGSSMVNAIAPVEHAQGSPESTNSSENSLHIADLRFDITSCILQVYPSEDRLVWGVDLHTGSRTVSGHEWKNHIEFERMFETMASTSTDWRLLIYRSISSENVETNERTPSAGIYVWRWMPISDWSVQIHDVNGPRLHIEGMCDINFDSKYGDDLRLSVDCDIDEIKVLAARKSQEQIRNEMVPYLDVTNFTFHQTDRGVSTLCLPTRQKSIDKP